MHSNTNSTISQSTSTQSNDCRWGIRQRHRDDNTQKCESSDSRSSISSIGNDDLTILKKLRPHVIDSRKYYTLTVTYQRWLKNNDIHLRNIYDIFINHTQLLKIPTTTFPKFCEFIYKHSSV